MTVRGVLFDLGDTLTRPIGGRWNPRFDFEEIVRRHHPDVDPAGVDVAVAAGQAFLDAAVDATPARADYHRVVLSALGVEDPTVDLLAELDRPLEVPPIEPFPEVAGSLAALRSSGVRLALVTDSWGTASSIGALVDAIGLGRFEAIAVSSEVGANKPDPRMYRTASDGLALRPQECLVVDDDPALVAAAIGLGYRGAAVDRAGVIAAGRVRTIASIDDVLDLVHDPDR